MKKYNEDYLYEMDFDDLVEVWNEFCIENDWRDDEVFENSDYGLDLCFSGEPLKLANAIYYGNYDARDGYYKFDGYGNIETISQYDHDTFIQDIIDKDELLTWLNRGGKN